MIQRYRHWLGEEARHMVESFDGDYVLYTDHLAVVRELVILCLDHGIISRGLACKYLGCAREDLDETVKEDSDGCPHGSIHGS